jgi:hypothetical protein
LGLFDCCVVVFHVLTRLVNDVEPLIVEVVKAADQHGRLLIKAEEPHALGRVVVHRFYCLCGRVELSVVLGSALVERDAHSFYLNLV